jgi:hypothetical protein
MSAGPKAFKVPFAFSSPDRILWTKRLAGLEAFFGDSGATS